ncbi:hypothetical protein EHEL_070835 [Encephalitozoon hellem ATCC 50504]|uniref:Uncharacterized protein n=1 Tax=Encephalitozoon hellem TaxID=27973 RepID=A0A9Q9FBT5_ENCHE|nr:uncharacterized protein EHEL_070835 [Encephalitozoon hellem ATCC 50504]AHL28948.1 hypothetical protein EHEL_070835 [Encephalitozoon hellem ATCC 50504]UTX43555.1 hypothetical protein GPU96_07g13150 [Encephalitozoon hellem]
MLQRFRDYLPFISGHPRGFKSAMDTDEALKILSMETRSTDIMQRYMQMMRINHPDRGGSPYIASKINEAKNLLAGRKLGSFWGP